MPPTVLHLVIIITVTDIVIRAKVIIISVIYYNRSHLIHDVNPSQLSGASRRSSEACVVARSIIGAFTNSLAQNFT